MAKLHFECGVMNSGKSLRLIATAHNYRERGMNVLIMKSAIDTRDGVNRCIIKSRAGAEVDGVWIEADDNVYSQVLACMEIMQQPLHAILIDEVQFLSVEQIEQLQHITMRLNIPVICYGLKTDFKGNLFPAVAKLLAICDEIEMTKSLCWCGKLAKQNARIHNGKIIKHGDVVDVGGNDKYIALCNRHYYEEKLG